MVTSTPASASGDEVIVSTIEALVLLQGALAVTFSVSVTVPAAISAALGV